MRCRPGASAVPGRRPVIVEGAAGGPSGCIALFFEVTTEGGIAIRLTLGHLTEFFDPGLVRSKPLPGWIDSIPAGTWRGPRVDHA